MKFAPFFWERLHGKKDDLGKLELRAAYMKPPSQIVLGSWIIVSLAAWELGEQGEQRTPP